MLPLVKDFINNALTEYILPFTVFFAIDGISYSEISRFFKSLMVQAPIKIHQQFSKLDLAHKHKKNAVNSYMFPNSWNT